jgi:hypothetical protein
MAKFRAFLPFLLILLPPYHSLRTPILKMCPDITQKGQSRIVKVEPRPGVEAASTRPPCARRHMADVYPLHHTRGQINQIVRMRREQVG